jgi:hypothetical protein
MVDESFPEEEKLVVIHPVKICYLFSNETIASVLSETLFSG